MGTGFINNLNFDKTNTWNQFIIKFIQLSYILFDFIIENKSRMQEFILYK